MKLGFKLIYFSEADIV